MSDITSERFVRDHISAIEATDLSNDFGLCKRLQEAGERAAWAFTESPCKTAILAREDSSKDHVEAGTFGLKQLRNI
jgi:hypothetical protein